MHDRTDQIHGYFSLYVLDKSALYSLDLTSSINRLSTVECGFIQHVTYYDASVNWHSPAPALGPALQCAAGCFADLLALWVWMRRISAHLLGFPPCPA